IVAVTRSGALASDIGRMGSNLVRDQPLLDVFTLGQTQMFFRRNVTQHGSPRPSGQRTTDAASDVVVTWSKVRYQGTEHVERRAVAGFDLPIDVHLDLVHGDMPRTFDHHLRAALYAAFG